MSHGFCALPLQFLFQIDSVGKTTGHSYKLVQNHCNKDNWKYFFSNRVISKWNKLDEETISAESADAFKRRLEKAKRKKIDLFLG